MKSSKPFTLRGQYNYFLDLQIKGTPPYQSCILSVHAFSRSDRKVCIATKCQWFRIRNSHKTQLLGIQSNTFQLSAQDIGALIEIQVHPQEEDYNGVGIVTFGKVVLDPSAKNTLGGVLSAGGSKFPVTVWDDRGKKDAALMITSDYLRIVSGEGAGEKAVKMRYSMENPEIEMNYIDVKKIALVFKTEM